MIFPPCKRPFRSPSNWRVLTPSILSLLVLVAPLFVAPTVLAQDQAVIDKIVQLNKKAMDDYDTADFDTAKKSLLDAEKAGKRSGLESHPVMARTYIHLGALYLIGFKDKAKAQHYFGKALDIQPDIRLDKTLTSTSVRDLFASVKGQKGEASPEESLFPPAKGGKAAKGAKVVDVGRDSSPGDASDAVPPESAARRRHLGKSVDPDAEPEIPTTIAALDCPYPDDTPPGKKVTLRCIAAANLNVTAVALFYKGYQMSDYEKLDMAKTAKGWWQTTVPKKHVDGKSLQFYFEGLDASDKPVVSNGRAESPNVMLIVDRGSQAQGAVPAEVDENPLEDKDNASPRLRLGKYDDSRVGVDTRYGNRRFWIGLGLGTGFVLAVNGVPESRVKGTLIPGTNTADPPNSQFDMSKDVALTGFGWAGLGQLVPEIGFQINPDWAVSIEGRHQWIPQDKKVASFTASGAHAALLKVMHYTKQRQLRAFYGIAVGGGEGVRMNIQTDPQNPQLKDTIRVGGILFGGTAGMIYEISRRASWIAEVNLLYGAPKQGLAVDINTGIQMNFGDTSGAAEAAAAKKENSVSTSIDDEDPK